MYMTMSIQCLLLEKDLNTHYRCGDGLQYVYYYYYYLFTTCNWVGTRWQESFKHIT